MSAVMVPQREAGYGPPTPVPIFQWEAEFSVLLDLYRSRAPKRVLEVGTYHGGTLYHWLQNAKRGAHIISLDSYRVGVDNRALYGSWCPPGVKVTALQGDSTHPTTAANVGRYKPFDWVWIDAGHYYHEVLADWEQYGPMCKPGGLVCFHDILPPSRDHPEIEVARLWDEIKAEFSTFEIVADRNAQWGGIGCVSMS